MNATTAASTSTPDARYGEAVIPLRTQRRAQQQTRGRHRSRGRAVAALTVITPFVLAPALAGCSSDLLGSDPFASDALNGVEINLDMPTINGSQPYLTLDVSIGGGRQVPMLVDTASPGIRILKTQLGKGDVTQTSTPVKAEFIDGTTFDGVEASAVVSFGGVKTAAPITFQLITKVSCQPQFPDCPGADGLQAYSKAQSFAGIFGIGLYSAPVYSPLSQLAGGAASSFSITSKPKTDSATLTLNSLPSGPAATYPLPKWSQPLPNGVPAWGSNEANACWSFGADPPKCLPTAFDTGSPFLIASAAVPGAPPVGDVTNDSQLTLFTTGDPQPVWSVVAGKTPGKNKVTITPTSAGEAVNTGSGIFRSHSVTFDSRNGQVLVAPAKQ